MFQGLISAWFCENVNTMLQKLDRTQRHLAEFHRRQETWKKVGIKVFLPASLYYEEDGWLVRKLLFQGFSSLPQGWPPLHQLRFTTAVMHNQWLTTVKVSKPWIANIPAYKSPFRKHFKVRKLRLKLKLTCYPSHKLIWCFVKEIKVSLT